MSRFLRLILFLLLAAGCAPEGIRQAQPSATPQAVWTATAPPPSVTPAPTVVPSETATVTPTPDPYGVYTIDYLRSRSYGGGEFQVTETLGDNGQFMRYLFEYPSEGLAIHGFMNIPKGDGPFPVVIALHGYIDPDVYNTFDYTTRYADTLANAGFLVIHPNLRGYRPSDEGDNLFRVGMAEDVLNLIALVKARGGQGGPLELADPDRIGLWGHSMGGGIVTRVITVSPDVRAAVLYAPMSGDERKNYEAILGWSNGERGRAELAVPVEVLTGISPEYFFDGITTPVSIHQGTLDQTVAVQWTRHTCDLLQSLGKTVECHFYEGAPHTFTGEADEDFKQDVLEFFERYLVR
jgi:uncharacterized protein